MSDYEMLLRRLQKFLEDFIAILVISDLEFTKIANKKFRFVCILKKLRPDFAE